MFQGVNGNLNITPAGTFDRGPNSITKVREAAVKMIDQWIKDRGGDNANILLKVVGHSRGGVAASLIAYDVSEKYPESSHSNIKIQLVQFDPVPGPKAISSAHQFGNGSYAKFAKIKLQDRIDAVVNYSLHIEGLLAGSQGFEPQIVLNADKYIFNDGNLHNAGTGSWFQIGNDRYKGSSLAEIGKGVYFAQHRGAMPDTNIYTQSMTPATSIFDLHVLCSSKDAESHEEGFKLWQQ